MLIEIALHCNYAQHETQLHSAQYALLIIGLLLGILFSLRTTRDTRYNFMVPIPPFLKAGMSNATFVDISQVIVKKLIKQSVV